MKASQVGRGEIVIPSDKKIKVTPQKEIPPSPFYKPKKPRGQFGRHLYNCECPQCKK